MSEGFDFLDKLVAAGVTEPPPKLLLSTAELRDLYKEQCRTAWNPRNAFARFSEYDRYRRQFSDAIYQWRYGANPKSVHSLGKLAWTVAHEINSGSSTWCLDFNDRKQRLYLGDGLMEYLKLLESEVEKVYKARWIGGLG